MITMYMTFDGVEYAIKYHYRDALMMQARVFHAHHKNRLMRWLGFAGDRVTDRTLIAKITMRATQAHNSFLLTL
jgi:hypothetical protein